MSPIRIGILGLAHGHVGMYCAQWKEMPGVQLVAAYDHDASRLSAGCEQFGLASCASAGALCARSDVDAVVIGAETSLHADMVEVAANAKKQIVLQKPLSLSLEDADRIIRAVEQNDVPLTIAWQMRIEPQNLKMRELVQSGVLGKILMVRRRHCLSTHVWPGFENTWHVKPELNRGMWADDAAHAVDFLLWLCGKPTTVMAEIDTLVNAKVPDDNGIAIYRYPTGTMAEIVCSFTSLVGENTTEIVGEKGVVIQNFGDAPSANFARLNGAVGLKWMLKDDKQWTVSDIPSPSNHAQRISALAPVLLEFLRGERPSLCSAREGRDSLQMILASYESAKTGTRVAIDP